MTNKCVFCAGNAQYLYKINGFDIYQCKHCKTSFVKDMPSEEELKNFYDGFNFCINSSNKYKICSKAFKDWYGGFNLPSNSKMLDIGGGGGFFSAAFEKYGFGEATYIDLDNQACEYAKTLNITRVINNSVQNLNNISCDKYNFIYCRHVIEHLTNPISLINSAIDLLNEGGLFILQFPNGLTLERISEKSTREYKINLLCNSNKITRWSALRLMYSDKTCADLEPLRHLWAISKKGISEFLSNRKDITFNIKMASIEDRIWSPYYHYPKDYTKLSRLIHNLIAGPSHIICKIRKS